MKFVAIDFETYYDKVYSIKTMGVDAYINDPQFDPYLVAIYSDEIQFVGHPRDFDWDLVKNKNVVAHNARFDETVHARCEELGIIPKGKSPSRWYCTADLAVFLQAPRSLAGAARALLGVTLDKSTRDKLAKLTYKEACAKGLKQEVDDYALSDAKHCYEIFEKYHRDWPRLEKDISQQNREDGRRGVRVDTPLLKENITKLTHTLWEAGNKIPWDWSDNKTPLSPKALKLQCRKEGIRCPTSLAKDSSDCIAWEETYGDKYPWVGAMRDWRRANIMLKRVETIRDRLKDDVFPYTIKYFGGHTGRFSGDGGFNMQNMPRSENMGVDLRGLFIPREGKKMVIADLAQIEARIILWLAGDMATLETVAGGVSVYEAHAIRTMGYDPARGPLEEVDPDGYRLAKARVLGLGFGCGDKKFRVLAKTMCNIDMTAKEAKQTVVDFRATNPKIVNFWGRLQRDCAWSKGKDFTVELPSGREMTYHSVKYGTDGLTAELEEGGGRRVYLYGGKIAENVTQATARDVFIEGMDRLNKAGHQQLFHAHDEHVLEVDKDVELKEIEKIIAVTPKWLEGCPIEAKVFCVERYTK